MKAISKILIIMFFLILLFYIYSELKKKPIGRDTVVSFGDRTYQILKDYYEKDNNVGTDYQLWKDNDDIILKFVYKYKDDSNYKKAYIVGKDDLNANFIYVIINYQKKVEYKYNCNELDKELYDTFFDNYSTFKFLKNNVLNIENICDKNGE